MLTYSEKLNKLRAELNGAPYCKDVNKLLPTLSENVIRNVVNGKGENPLVLTALEIVLKRRANKLHAEALRLKKQAERAGVLV